MGTGTSFIVSERTTTFLEKKKVSGSEWGPFLGRKETGGGRKIKRGRERTTTRRKEEETSYITWWKPYSGRID